MKKSPGRREQRAAHRRSIRNSRSDIRTTRQAALRAYNAWEMTREQLLKIWPLAFTRTVHMGQP